MYLKLSAFQANFQYTSFFILPILFDYHHHIPRTVSSHNQRLLNISSLRRAGYISTKAIFPGMYTLICFMHIIHNSPFIKQNHQFFRNKIKSTLLDILFYPNGTILRHPNLPVNNCQIRAVQFGRVLNIIRIKSSTCNTFQIGSDTFGIGIRLPDQFVYILSFL